MREMVIIAEDAREIGRRLRGNVIEIERMPNDVNERVEERRDRDVFVKAVKKVEWNEAIERRFA